MARASALPIVPSTGGAGIGALAEGVEYGYCGARHSGRRRIFYGRWRSGSFQSTKTSFSQTRSFDYEPGHVQTNRARRTRFKKRNSSSERREAQRRCRLSPPRESTDKARGSLTALERARSFEGCRRRSASHAVIFKLIGRQRGLKSARSKIIAQRRVEFCAPLGHTADFPVDDSTPGTQVQ